MAKVSGPLFSMEASGSYGGAITFAKWKGRQYSRQLVIPANPHSADQETARNRLRVTGAIQAWANTTALVLSGQTDTDKVRITAITPGGFAWNGYLVDKAIGAGGLVYTAARAAWTALQAGEKTAWGVAAAALTPAIADVYQTVAGGGAGTAMNKGEVFFIYMYALSQMGLTNTPGATPPTYA